MIFWIHFCLARPQVKKEQSRNNYSRHVGLSETTTWSILRKIYLQKPYNKSKVQE